MSQNRRLMLIELNEFSVELFQRGVRELGLPNVARLLQMPQGTTITDDQVEHRGLDPWVQWVSVHTGLPSSEHGVIHLGDAPAKLGRQQLWEALSARGITSGVWGAMNATRGDAEHCHFFLPDPWTFMEEAYPAPLNDLLALPRYYSKNYLDVSKSQFARQTMRLLRYVLGSQAVGRLAMQAPFLFGGLARTGLTNAFLFSAFDLFSAELFIAQRRQHEPQLSLIFLNSIAHLQHHRWETGPALTSDLAFGLRTIDRVLGTLFSDLAPGEAVIVMNALTQKNIVGEKPRICYRQLNPQVFLRTTGLPFEGVEQLMTNDAHVFFATREQRDAAAAALSEVVLDGQPFFHVEPSAEDEHKLFFQIDFWDEIGPGRDLQVNGRSIAFDRNFEAIVARTGAHVNNGNVFYQGLALPSRAYNHEVGLRVAQWLHPQAQLGAAGKPGGLAAAAS
jgi:hypothetical protein